MTKENLGNIQNPSNVGDIYKAKEVEDYYKIQEKIGKDTERMQDYDEFLLSILPKDMKGMTVADLACGNGQHAELFCQRGASRVLAFDYSAAMLDQARKRKIKNNLSQLDLVKADIMQPPLGNKKFDLIFSRFGMMYGSNLKEMLHAVADSLKPEGHLVIMTNLLIEKGEPSQVDAARGKVIPLDLALGENMVKLKNFAYTMQDYQQACQKAGLKMTIEVHFKTVGLTVSEDCEYKDGIDFEYVVIKAEKIKNEQ